NDPRTPETYTLSLHDALPILRERVFRGETLRGIETTASKKDGTPVTVSLAAAPLQDAGGRVTGTLLIAADLTEMRRLEVQYRQRSEEHTSELQSLRHLVCRLL